ncbi:haloacid dehalogenase-like hydrolase [Raphidocelis subcapitata]|uniref:Haloacid dehalogenase-like hydrolase n=1 Tax=Raphidocelis subcapitata TaxID=307507 RepID=A0A2V0NPX9_9CHLO|nr:haloacid dehalogenase-like hydrolase [Raphidocelis subcapitata]|eukprot:GBF87560.1 haloacid dehalogenase-like hydrolase [Raphidocelis subcapitata]
MISIGHRAANAAAGRTRGGAAARPPARGGAPLPLGGGARCRRAPAPADAAAAGRGVDADIRIIASDCDGTLLNSRQLLTPGVEAAVLRAHEAGVPLIVATGKARGPWAPEVLPRLGAPMPGVFLQGLLITDAQGRTMLSRCLEEEVLLACIRLARAARVTLTAYSDDRILCDATDAHTERLLFYKEPPPEALGDLERVVIFMAPQQRIDELRPEVEAAMEGRASITTAISGMLEVLPLGASKGAGVEWLLREMGRDPAHLMAIGDGENDIEMLQLAALGVAMGNAGPRVKAAADRVVASNDEDGVAEAIEAHVLGPRRAAARSAA